MAWGVFLCAWLTRRASGGGGLTAPEPDDDMAEVAVTVLKAVLSENRGEVIVR